MLPPFSALVAVERACPNAGATPKQPIIGSSGSTKALEPGDGRIQRRRQRLPVDPPVDLVSRRQAADKFRVHDVAGKRRPRPTGGADRRHAHDLDLQRVARLGPGHEDRPVHRIGLGSALHAVLVDPVRVERLGDHRVARLYREGGRQGARAHCASAWHGSDASSWSDCVAQRRRLGKDQPIRPEALIRNRCARWRFQFETEIVIIRKLKSGEYRLYSRKVDPKTGKRKNLGTFKSREAAEKHEREVQYFKRH